MAFRAGCYPRVFETSSSTRMGDSRCIWRRGARPSSRRRSITTATSPASSRTARSRAFPASARTSSSSGSPCASSASTFLAPASSTSMSESSTSSSLSPYSKLHPTALPPPHPPPAKATTSPRSRPRANLGSCRSTASIGAAPRVPPAPSDAGWAQKTFIRHGNRSLAKFSKSQDSALFQCWWCPCRSLAWSLKQRSSLIRCHAMAAREWTSVAEAIPEIPRPGD